MLGVLYYVQRNVEQLLFTYTGPLFGHFLSAGELTDKISILHWNKQYIGLQYQRQAHEILHSKMYQSKLEMLRFQIDAWQA
jgi:hypothetical protein